VYLDNHISSVKLFSTLEQSRRLTADLRVSYCHLIVASDLPDEITFAGTGDPHYGDNNIFISPVIRTIVIIDRLA
jgi:hypothetical protein